ncbi:MAG: tandem-95 repeat protein [Thermoplasmata archaeon]|nr:tandem-95 repeat protein [Thermoplasmata archaeon]
MKSKIIAIWMCTMLIFSSVVITVGNAEGKTVDDTPNATWNVPGDFGSINEAINNAGVVGGDTILVGAGTYTQNVFVHKQLTIIGEDRDTTIIDANYAGHGFNIIATGASVSGFHVINAIAPSNGIYLDNANLCNISDNIVSNSDAGIYAISDNSIISQNHVYDNEWVGIRLWGSENNTVWGNNASLNDQGINLYGDANTNTVYGNTFFNNSNHGIYLAANSNLNTFHNNTVSYSNYSIYFDGACLGNTFYNNNFKNANIDHVNDPAPAGNFYDNGLPDGGNYWDDYAGVDTDFDDIGDTLVPHPAANFDQYPWVNADGWIINQPPVITDAAGTLAYTEGQGAAIIDSTITITDADDTNLVEAWINITANYQISKDWLDFVDMGSITKDVAGSNADELHLVGTDTLANYELALESVTFENTAGNPTTGIRTITWQVSDGDNSSAVVTSTVTMNPVNSAPVAVDDGYTTDEATVFITGNVTINDTDPEGDMITVFSLDNTGTIGLVTNNTEGRFIYNPSGQFNYLAVGEQAFDFFNYSLTDGELFDTGMVTITIDGINDVPTAVDDGGPGFVVNEAAAANTASVLTNDTDPDTNDVLSVNALNDTGAIGLVTNNADGTFNYDPNGQFDYLAVGEIAYDFFNYTVMDGNGGLDSAMVTIIITGENIAPIAVDDGGPGFITDEDSLFTTASVLTNDTDIDTNDVLSVSAFDVTGTIGLVTDNGDGTFDYNPNGNFDDLAVGEQAFDFFNHTITDGLAFDTAMVTIIINGANDAPVVDAGGPYTINEGDQVILDGSGSYDPDGDTIISYAWDLDNDGAYDDATGVNPTVTWATLRSLGLASEGTALTIGLEVTDSNMGAGTGAGTLTINNLAPTADAGGPYVINEGEDLVLNGGGSTDPGSDALAYAWDLDNDGAYDDATGVDTTVPWAELEALGLAKGTALTIGLEITDTGTASSTDATTLTINNIAPIANNDAATVDEDSSATTIDVLANDDDIDALTIITVTQGAHGAVTITDSGKNVSYEPDADYVGTDTFTYTIDDGEFNDTATVTVTVENVNDDPVAVDDEASVDEDSFTTIYVLNNDIITPDEGETPTVVSVTQGTHGTVSIASGNSRVDYEPDADYVGTDTFTYTISDGNGGTATATITMTVSNVNDWPTITTTGTLDAAEGDAYSVDFDAIDIDGDTIIWSVSGASWLSIDTAGVLGGTALTGTYSIEVTASDGNGGSDIHSYTLTVGGLDSDDDGVPDDDDAFPDDATESVDTDGDGTGDNADSDKDGDGVPNTDDDFPLDPTETIDTDGDGIGNNADTDDDGDGVIDTMDTAPLDSEVTGKELSDDWPYWGVVSILLIIFLEVLIAMFILWFFTKRKKDKDEE